MNQETEILHKTAVEIARKFHQAEAALIDILQKIDDKKVYLKLEFTSLFDYAVKALKLSEANASNFITVARKSKAVPELKAAIEAGDITVSKARKITPILTPENQARWIELAKTLPKAKLEKEVARVMPENLVEERSRYVTENRIELMVGLSEDLMKKLRRVQDLVSQKSRKPANLEETIYDLVQFFLERQDPLEKAKRNANGQPIDATASVPGTRYIPAPIKHQVQLRDQAQCTHKDSKGQRCDNKRWLEIHHQMPLFYGGANDLNNLQTLCNVHHRQVHKHFFLEV